MRERDSHGSDDAGRRRGLRRGIAANDGLDLVLLQLQRSMESHDDVVNEKTWRFLFRSHRIGKE